MTDYWPSEEGAIVEGGLVLNCYADGAISEGSSVKWGTAAANRLPVAATAAFGDACGVALKAASAAGDFQHEPGMGGGRPPATYSCRVGFGASGGATDVRPAGGTRLAIGQRAVAQRRLRAAEHAVSGRGRSFF